jgi:hypothetical protein
VSPNDRLPPQNLASLRAAPVMCRFCCWGDRCDDPRHYYRPECPVCRGAGWFDLDEHRPIEGFPGYRVFVAGRVETCRTTTVDGFGDVWRPLSPGVGRRGHLRVGLCSGRRRRRQAFIHTLVLEAFVGPRPPGTEACHFPDPDPSNNRLDNLRWDSRTANHADSISQGRHSHGERHGHSRITDPDSVAIRELYSNGVTQKDISNVFGISQVMVSRIVRGKAWRHTLGGLRDVR